MSSSIQNLTIALCLMLVPSASSQSSEEWGKGQSLFYSNCAICHGRDGRGGRGPNLVGSLKNGNLDSDIETIVRNGLPDTAMPKFNFEDDELQALMRYIQSLRHAAPPALPPEGDRMAGKQLYHSQGCPSCHEIGNEGSTLGPNLTRIGAARSYEYLKTSIVDPSVDVPEQNRSVKIVTRDGRQYQGMWVNEDSFTVQIRLRNESFASFDKQDLKEVLHEKDSLMPAYHFRDTDLKNLLAYLSSLVGVSEASEINPGRRQR